MSVVLGLDLSLTATGVALVVDGKLTDGDTVESKGKAKASLSQRAARLLGLHSSIIGIYEEFVPDLVVIESPSYGSQVGQQHDRSGLWWLVTSALESSRVGLVATVTPNGRAKYATGKGNANKDAVLAAVIRRYEPRGWEIENNNVADAVVLAAMGSRHLGEPVEASLPQDHLAAMDGAAWPG